MGLLTETNAQYYAGQQTFTAAGDAAPPYETFTWTGNTTLSDVSGSVPANYTVTINGVLAAPVPTVSNNVVQLGQATVLGDQVVITLSQTAINNNYGSYEYISLHDVINNFIVAYVGKDKIIPDIKRTDVMFHAKRGLQEFSYDTLKSIKSQELTVPPSLSVIIPQDYVNYVKCSWVDSVGAKHIIYPTRVTSNPTELPIQDTAGVPTQDSLGQNLQANESQTEERWAEQDNTAYEGFDDYRYPKAEFVFGQRYGLEPEEAQINGKFTINERLGKISFSSDLNGKLIILEYISDGLATDEDMKIPKFAEEAIYMHIAHAILSVRSNIPEYVINRFKKDRRAALRNAKIRLSNIKIEEIAQVFRNKSKIIKH
tara:strand:+ start:3598 stop:4710 length:1113 start_codon:yes stop_codon:yes gene_type:complete